MSLIANLCGRYFDKLYKVTKMDFGDRAFHKAGLH